MFLPDWFLGLLTLLATIGAVFCFWLLGYIGGAVAFWLTEQHRKRAGRL